MSFSMKIYFRPSLYLFLKILVNSLARMPDFSSVNEALFCTGVTTLLRDPWGGLALVPLITILFRFAFANLRGYFNCWSEKNTGNTLKVFYLSK